MRKSKPLTVLLLGCALFAAGTVVADPPPHAKAHGWRAKHVGAAGHEWELDYGVATGRCDHRAVATAVGGIVGGVIARRVADGDNRTVATLIGAAAGALIGHQIGKRIDKADEACVGHALEIGRSGHAVAWRNDASGVQYQLTPGVTRTQSGSTCREFQLLAVSGTERSTRQGLACLADRGVWEIVG